ncbi:replication-relaxation family protein [Rathayibacter sp. AY1B5]|uniref:replication-relaxation family protein n=1 Tax=Rathayibacter sp. AY1B5 TaxID=2080530 RepID=UPI000CE751A9|nr:replication-relaxation family protein [Rathayibacter sp. AY1B5]PPI21265.1 hypothetical protein C5D44_15350 [Rathayibacter sp. AY1B5]
MSSQRRRTIAEPRPTEQEQAVLRFLLEQRYATSRQLARAARARYGSDRSAARQTNRLLQKLGSIGLLHVLPRTVGGQARGSSAGIWTITNRGARLAGTCDPNPEQRKKRYRRDQDPTLTFLEHTLAISELRVHLAELEDSKRLRVESITPEPACWRPYLGPAGQRLFLKPDLAVVTSTPDGYEDHWFLEVDLATENPARIITKCRQYQQYRRSGLEQRHTGLGDIFFSQYDSLDEAIDDQIESLGWNDALTALQRDWGITPDELQWNYAAIERRFRETVDVIYYRDKVFIFHQ